ncbi:MAG: universal stress protein [Promethearchaeota archaeon]|nr:MAG: universal stress protein [Candidatus Lokiarchaeota archaeon]
MISKMLVGIDDSEHAERTLTQAHELQQKLNCELVIFHSIKHKMISQSYPLPIPAFSPGAVYRIPLVDYTKIEEEYRNHGKKILEKAKKIVGANNPKIETRLIEDFQPEDYMKMVSKEESFDLIILGSKGDHNVVEKLIGSIPEKVIKDVECNVLLVK